MDIQGGVAFLPDDPPLDVPITIDVLNALDAARGALGEFIGQARLVPNDLLITEPLLTIEAVESNRIEGTHTLIANVLRQEVAGAPEDADEAGRNLEVLLYRNALRAGEAWLAQGRSLNQVLIRALHVELLSVGRGRDATPGAYRSTQVLIGNRSDTPQTARFVPPPPEQVQPLMDRLVEFLVEPPAFPALISCAIAHYQFEAVHPFLDGNGRVGRLLIPLFLTSQAAIPRPILYLSAYLEAHRDEYYENLKRVSTHGDWNRWIAFFLRAVEAQAVDSKDRVERILALRERYRGRVREASRSQAALAAVDLVMSRMWVTAPDLSEYAKCSFNAAKAALEAMERLGLLRRDRSLYPATWYSPDLITEVYD